MNNDQIKQKADTLIEVMNIINNSYSLAEAKKKINTLALAALNNYHKTRK